MSEDSKKKPLGGYAMFAFALIALLALLMEDWVIQLVQRRTGDFANGWAVDLIAGFALLLALLTCWRLIWRASEYISAKLRLGE